jgi:hypothetical protein
MYVYSQRDSQRRETIWSEPKREIKESQHGQANLREKGYMQRLGETERVKIEKT